MDHGDMNIVQAESLPADLAMEMAVQFLDPTSMVVVTEAIFCGTASILDDMQQMMLRKKSQRAKDRRFVQRIGLGFEIGQAERMLEALHGLKHQHSDGRRPDSMLQQELFTMTAVHFRG